MWLLPRELVYWCALRVCAHATRESVEEVCKVTAMDALECWRKTA
jgi:hypothetical protein